MKGNENLHNNSDAMTMRQGRRDEEKTREGFVYTEMGKEIISEEE